MKRGICGCIIVLLFRFCPFHFQAFAQSPNVMEQSAPGATKVYFTNRVESFTNTAGVKFGSVKLTELNARGLRLAPRIGSSFVPMGELPESEYVRLGLPASYRQKWMEGEKERYQESVELLERARQVPQEMFISGQEREWAQTRTGTAIEAGDGVRIRRVRNSAPLRISTGFTPVRSFVKNDGTFVRAHVRRSR